jgi:hypothetical protein
LPEKSKEYKDVLENLNVLRKLQLVCSLFLALENTMKPYLNNFTGLSTFDCTTIDP